jgi:hypothetical protein
MAPENPPVLFGRAFSLAVYPQIRQFGIIPQQLGNVGAASPTRRLLRMSARRFARFRSSIPGLIAVATAMALFAAPHYAAASGPKTATRTATLRGVAQPDSTDVGPQGQCDVGFADQCLSGTCSCFEITDGTAVGSLIGKGNGKATNFFVTVDDGDQTATEPPLGSRDGSCQPFFGVVTLSNPKTGETMTLNLVGATCKHLTSVNKKDVITGGFGIANTPAAPSPVDTSGWGTLSGTFDKNSQKVTLKLGGPITQ